MKTWKVVSSRYLLKRWWMNLREDHILLPGGAELPEFHVIEYPDWACVICITTENQLIMVEQYRHGIQRFSLELPAGAVEPGEDPLDTAKRELIEETGYASEDWSLLGKCAPEPSKHTNYAYIYVARQAKLVATPDLDESEYLTVHLMKADDVLATAGTDVFHGTHLTALFWAAYRDVFSGG